MTYEEAKAMKAAVEAEHTAARDAMKVFPRRLDGLTPDHVRETFDYQAAKIASDIAFEKLRRYNTLFLKTFRKEYTADRRNKHGNV